MYMHVPTLYDSRCHQSGTTERMNPKPENTENALLRAVIFAALYFLKLPEGRNTKSLN
jgi:hypothetical protein